MKTKNTLVLLAAWLLGALSAFAQNPGDLDLTFNANDNGFYNLWGANSTVYATAVQPDGKYLIAGAFQTWNGTTVRGITRLNPDATIDATFNSGNAIGTGMIFTMELLSNGKILIGGQFNIYNGKAINNIARLNANGTLDTTFTVGTGFNNAVRKLKTQPDGKILAGGQFTDFNGKAVPALRV